MWTAILALTILEYDPRQFERLSRTYNATDLKDGYLDGKKLIGDTWHLFLALHQIILIL